MNCSARQLFEKRKGGWVVGWCGCGLRGWGVYYNIQYVYIHHPPFPFGICVYILIYGQFRLVNICMFCFVKQKRKANH